MREIIEEKIKYHERYGQVKLINLELEENSNLPRRLGGDTPQYTAENEWFLLVNEDEEVEGKIFVLIPKKEITAKLKLLDKVVYEGKLDVNVILMLVTNRPVRVVRLLDAFTIEELK